MAASRDGVASAHRDASPSIMPRASALRAVARRADALATRGGAIARDARAPPPPRDAVDAVDDVWEAVRDARTGRTYYWNVETDETTALDAAKPRTYSAIDPSATRAPPPTRTDARDATPREGFGAMLAQGAAWGMGSSIGHRVIGGMFGYGGYGGAPSVHDAPGETTAAPTPPDFGAREFDDDDGFGFGDGGDGGDGGSMFDFFSED